MVDETFEEKTRDRLAALLAHHGLSPDLVPKAAQYLLRVLGTQPFAPFGLVALGRRWASEDSEITRFRTWCLNHPRKCREIFRFSPNPRMSGIQCFQAALQLSFAVVLVKIPKSDLWGTSAVDRLVIQRFLEQLVVEALRNG